MRLSICQYINNLVHKIVIWKAQGLPQSNDAVNPMHKEGMETTQKTNCSINNIPGELQVIETSSCKINVQFVFNELAKGHAVSTKLSSLSSPNP